MQKLLASRIGDAQWQRRLSEQLQEVMFLGNFPKCQALC